MANIIILYHSPVTCSLASRLALIEAGLEHRLEIIRTDRGENLAPGYLAVNPAGKVPALRVEDATITESSAILPLLADLAPAANLMSKGAVARAQAQAVLSFLSTTVHAAWTQAMRPERFVGDSEVDTFRDGALKRLGHAFAIMEARLQNRDLLVEELSVCELYPAVFLIWRMSPVALGRFAPTPALDALQGRIFSRAPLGAALANDMMLRAS